MAGGTGLWAVLGIFAAFAIYIVEGKRRRRQNGIASRPWRQVLRETWTQHVRPRFATLATAPPPAVSPPRPAPDPPTRVEPPEPAPDPPAERPAPPPGPPLSGNGHLPAMAPPPALTIGDLQRDVVSSVHGLTQAAMAGDIGAKRRYMATMASMFSSASEALENMAAYLQDRGYSPSVWEQARLMSGAAAAGSSQGENATAALDILLHTRVGEIAGTGQRLPHPDEINGR